MSPPEPADPPLLTLTQRARRRLLALVGTLAAVLAIPYLVPDLASLQPWRLGGNYVPFWNVVARARAEREEGQQRQQVEDFEALALSAEQEQAQRVAAERSALVVSCGLSLLSMPMISNFTPALFFLLNCSARN